MPTNLVTQEQINWINLVKQGNELAAYNLYKSYSKAMYNTIIRITGDSEISKDLLQEGFVKVLKGINKLEDPIAFPSWIKRIMINTSLEFMRKKQIVFEEFGHEHEEAEEFNEQLIPDEAIHKAIKELPDGCRTVLNLHLIEGFKHSEVAIKLGISESTSKSQLRHAKKLLKNKLSAFYAN